MLQNRRLSKLHYIHTTEYYAAIKNGVIDEYYRDGKYSKISQREWELKQFVQYDQSKNIWLEKFC